MGNSAWGHGYHTGFNDGARQTGLISAAVALGGFGLVEAGKWAFRKRRAQKFAEADRVAATEEHTDDVELDVTGADPASK